MKHTPEFLAFKATLPKNGSGVLWDIQSFSRAVEILAPGYKVEDGQEWINNSTNLWLVCPEHGRYQVTPGNFLGSNRDTGCAQCQAQKHSDSAGKIRRSRASEAEKNKARQLYSELSNYAEVGRIMGRDTYTISRWCNPDQEEKRRVAAAIWRKNNPERAAAGKKKYLKFPHGKAVNRANSNRRRKLKQEDTHVNEYGVPERVFHLPATGIDMTREQAFYLEAERLTKETGIQYHVDHIKPICKGGEHTWWNLQVITAEENMSKGGKYRPEDKALYAMRIAAWFSDIEYWSAQNPS